MSESIIAGNVEEAIGGHSEKDFSAKISIAYKEARETRYWICLLRDCNILESKISASFLKDIEEIIKITGSNSQTKNYKIKIPHPNSRLLTPDF